MREFATLGYIIFDDKVAVPNLINISNTEFEAFNLANMIIPEYGVILPLYRIYPDGNKINQSFFESAEYNYAFGVIFLALDKDGYVNQYYIEKQEKRLERWPLPIHQKRFFRSDSRISQNEYNAMLKDCDNVIEAIYQFEQISGIPSENYQLYDREQLHQLAAGVITINDISVESVPSQYNTIWLT